MPIVTHLSTNFGQLPIKDKKNHFHLSCKTNMDVFWINSFSISIVKLLGWLLNIKIISGHQGFTSHYEDN